MSEIVHESADQLPQGQFRSTDQTTPSDIAIPQLQPGAQTHENKVYTAHTATCIWNF